jgi:hypothetical protein
VGTGTRLVPKEGEMKRLSVVIGLTAILTAAFAGIAKADSTLGSTAFPAGSSARACNGSVIAEPTSSPATPYAVPSAPGGPLTSWQVNTAGSTAGTPVTLLLLRLTAADTYTVAATDTQAIPSSPGAIATFIVLTPIAVSGGEILALYSPGGTFTCWFQDGSTPTEDSLISFDPGGNPAVGQSLTTDDRSDPGYMLNVAASLTAPVPTKKKTCKKKHKKHSADSAKKKKCKKKKRK